MGEVLVIVLLAGLCLALIVALPAAGLWWLARWLKRRNYQRAAVATQVLLACFGAFCLSVIYSFYFPFDSEFEKEFVSLTALPFPASGKIIRGDESGLDSHGDYTACARILVSEEDYECVLMNIRGNSSFRPTRLATDSSFVSSKEFQYATKGIRSSDYILTFSKGQVNVTAYEFIGFLHDRRTIVMYRCSS